MPQNDETANRPELIFALVGAAGVRLDDLSIALKQALTTFGYKPVDIRLSDLLRNFTDWVEPGGAGESERIRHLQKMGDELRERLQDGAALRALASQRFARNGLVFPEARIVLRRHVLTLYAS